MSLLSDERDYIPVSQAAGMLHVSVPRVRQLIKRGKLDGLSSQHGGLIVSLRSVLKRIEFMNSLNDGYVCGKEFPDSDITDLVKNRITNVDIASIFGVTTDHINYRISKIRKALGAEDTYHIVFILYGVDWCNRQENQE